MAITTCSRKCGKEDQHNTRFEIKFISQSRWLLDIEWRSDAIFPFIPSSNIFWACPSNELDRYQTHQFIQYMFKLFLKHKSTGDLIFIHLVTLTQIQFAGGGTVAIAAGLPNTLGVVQKYLRTCVINDNLST